MIITSEDKREQIEKEYPILKKLDSLWLLSKEFEILDLYTLSDVVKECSISHEKFIPKIKKCDNFGFKLMVKFDDFQIKMFELYPEENGTSYSLGVVLGIHNFYGPHCSNVALTTEGIMFIEPQTDEITKEYSGQFHSMIF